MVLLALGRGGGRLLRGVAVVMVTLAVVAGAGALGLAWRLGQGPLDVTAPAQWAASATASGVGFDEVMLAWSDAPGDRGLLVQARGVRTEGAEMAAVEADLPVAALLAGDVWPRRVEVAGLRVQATPGKAPGWSGGGDAPRLAEVLDALRRPEGGLAALQHLRQVRVRDAVLQADDPALGPVRVAGDVDLERAAAGGVTGTAALRVVAGSIETALDLRATADAGGTRVSATTSPIETAALLKLAPQTLPATVEGAVTLALDAELTDTLLPRTVVMRAGMGGGRLRLPGSTLALDSMAVEAKAEWDGSDMLPVRMALDRAQVVLASPGGGAATTVIASGRATRVDGRVAAEGDVRLDRLPLADLPQVWPEAWGGNARPWIVRNLSAGMARDGEVSVALDAREDGSDLQVRRFTAALTGDDVTIHWLRPAPPVEHAQVRLAMQDLNTIEITVPSARQGPLTLANGTVRVAGLAQKDQDLAINADVGGAVPDVLTLLRHPRLKLADKLPPVRNPGGTLAGKLTVTLPLEGDLQFEQVSIRVAGRLQGLRLGNLVARRDFDRGDVQAEVTQDGLRATGTGTLATVPGQFAVDLDFRNGAPDQVAERVKASGRVTPRQLAAAGLDAGDVFGGGSAGYEAEYVGRRDKRASVVVRADLRGAALAVAGWTKAPGAAANASATIRLQNGDLQGVDSLQAQGPGLELRGRADMVGRVPALLVLERIVLGPTRASGQIELPTEKGGPVRASLVGTVLDLSKELSGGGGSGKEDAEGTPFVADIKFDTVLLADAQRATGVSAHAEYDGRTIRVLRVQSSGPERIQVVIAPEGRTRRVSIRSANGGGLLRAFDITESVRGGALAVEARYDDTRPGSPLSGTLDISDFHVKDGVVAGKVLQALTLYGIPDALSGPGLAFSRLIMPFRWHREVLDLGEMQAFSASLGLTAKGRVDVGRKRADVTGTLVPAYVLNSALGRLPLVGSLFSPEKGGGLVAMEYGVRGPLADVSISVNPLSALTPGALRRLFRLFD